MSRFVRAFFSRLALVKKSEDKDHTTQVPSSAPALNVQPSSWTHTSTHPNDTSLTSGLLTSVKKAGYSGFSTNGIEEGVSTNVSDAIRVHSGTLHKCKVPVDVEPHNTG